MDNLDDFTSFSNSALRGCAEVYEEGGRISGSNTAIIESSYARLEVGLANDKLRTAPDFRHTLSNGLKKIAEMSHANNAIVLASNQANQDLQPTIFDDPSGKVTRFDVRTNNRKDVPKGPGFTLG
jgi:hypothetical protein